MERATDPVQVAHCGSGLGAEFISVYQRHPNAEMYTICQRTQPQLGFLKGTGLNRQRKRYTRRPRPNRSCVETARS